MKKWLIILLIILAIAVVGAGICAVAGINPIAMLACDMGDPVCGA